MLKTSARVLRLLALLQARREWSGAELGERLEVDVRTIRREASAGPGGGYRLGAGSATPPLLLEDDEVIAVAVALGATAGSVANLQDVGLRVLMKLDQLLPARLRRRLGALQAMTLSLVAGGAPVDARLLTTVATACRDSLLLRFTYRDRKGGTTQRQVEPLRVVHTGRVWYLAAWDRGRADWRTFRIDRMEARSVARGERFAPRPPPEDLTTFVSRAISASPYRHQARLRVPGSVEALRRRIPRWVGVLEPLDDRRCLLTIGADTPEALTALIVNAGVDFELLDPPELARPIRAIAARLQRGTRRRRRRASLARRD